MAFISGRAFCARGGDALRLNFSRTTPDQIHDGMARRGRLLHPRGPVIALPAGFCLRGGAAARAASRTIPETHEPRS